MPFDAATETHIVMRERRLGEPVVAAGATRRAPRRGARIAIDVPSPNRVAVQEISGDRASHYGAGRGPWRCFICQGRGRCGRRIESFSTRLRVGGFGWVMRADRGDRERRRRHRARAAHRARPPWPAPITPRDRRRFGRGLARLRSAAPARCTRSSIVADRPFDIQLTWSGDGPALPPLRELATRCNLDRTGDVCRNGHRTRARRFVQGARIMAVSSLGLHRIGLARASVLKAREYCALASRSLRAATILTFHRPCRFVSSSAAAEETGDVIGAFEAFDRSYRQMMPSGCGNTRSISSTGGTSRRVRSGRVRRLRC